MYLYLLCAGGLVLQTSTIAELFPPLSYLIDGLFLSCLECQLVNHL